MGGLLARIVGGIVSSILGYADIWFTRQRAKQNEWAAKTRGAQLKSVGDALRVQGRIRKGIDSAAVSRSPSEWNRRGMSPLLVLALLPLAVAGRGCLSVYSHPMYPVIPAVERPQVPTDPPEWTPRERILAEYADRLEAAIRGYNGWAIDENSRNGYYVPDGP